MWILMPTASMFPIAGFVFCLLGQGLDSCVAQQDKANLPAKVTELLKGLPKGTRVGFAVLNEKGKIVAAHNANDPLATASSVKSALLLELLAKYANHLD